MPDLARRPGEAATLASAAYQQLRQAIIGGRLKADQRLHIQKLAAELDVGSGALREALNRLVSERLVVQLDQRGFRVASLELSDLDDLFDARCWVNAAALRAAIARGDGDWEARLCAALAALSGAPRLTGLESGLRGSAWEDAHAAFHDALVSACGSDWMRAFCRLTADAAARFRAASRTLSQGQRDEGEEHRQIVQAAIARDADRAVALLTAHFRHTQQIVRDGRAA